MSYASEVLADSPAAYWKLDEASGTAAADSSGNGLDGTYTGGVTLNQSGPGAGAPAPLFDGTSGYVNVAHNALLAITGDLTLEAWVNPTDRSNYWFIVTKDLSNAARPYEWRLNTTSGIPEYDHTGGGATASAAPATGGWSHLAITCTAAGALIHYLNGSPNGSAGLGGTPSDAGTALKIGSRDDLFSFFKGLIAHVAIYPAVLSGARIAAHYNAPFTPITTTFSVSDPELIRIPGIH